MKDFLKSGEQKILTLISQQNEKRAINVYFGIDVGKTVLDVGITIDNSAIQLYLGSIENNAKGFKKLEHLIKSIIMTGVNENNIFLATENTGTYGHDVTNFFEDRLPNVYILNSTLTCSARQFYASDNFKNDEIDSIVIATTLRDLDNKGCLESTKNPFKQNRGMSFVRRSFSKESDTLRMLFRNLASLREEKSRLMTTINMYKERLYPEIRDVFKIKSRSTTQNLLLKNFTRDEILQMTESDFLEKYKAIASKGQQQKNVLEKVCEFYEKVVERGAKISCSEIDNIIQQKSDDYIVDDIKFKQQYYDLVSMEMKVINEKIGDILGVLKRNGYFIPSFRGINDNELGIFLGELGNGIYDMSSRELMGFVGWHPNNYTSGGGHMVKASKFSSKDSVIKKFVYIWMYGFNLHNKSFSLYKKLLGLSYGIDSEPDSLIKIKNKRKIEAKAGYKLLEIIHSCYRYSCGFDEERFLSSSVIPLISNIKEKGISDDMVKNEILDVYDRVPGTLSIHCK